MKLYATVTSERATKGQGGNEFLTVNIFDGQKICHGSIDIRPDLSMDIRYRGEKYTIKGEPETKQEKLRRLETEFVGKSGDVRRFIEEMEALEKEIETEKGEKQKGESRPEKCYTCKSPYFNMANTCQGCGRQY